MKSAPSGKYIKSTFYVVHYITLTVSRLVLFVRAVHLSCQQIFRCELLNDVIVMWIRPNTRTHALVNNCYCSKHTHSHLSDSSSLTVSPHFTTSWDGCLFHVSFCRSSEDRSWFGCLDAVCEKDFWKKWQQTWGEKDMTHTSNSRNTTWHHKSLTMKLFEKTNWTN